ncbi:MAG: CHAT domain-containing protein [Saprospiraceae bacterium]|nr:CHAT domain-containing protein [Saprospiraceae bacterium]
MKYAFLFLLVSTLTCVSAQTVDSIAIKQVDSLIKFSRDLTSKRDFDKALEVNAAAEIIALEKLGKESAAYGSTGYNHGRISYAKGDYQEAEKGYLESKVIREKVLGRLHPDFSMTLANLAILYEDMGQNLKAEQYYRESLELRRITLGANHPRYSVSLNNLGLFYLKIGKLLAAEPLLLEAMEHRRVFLDSLHPDYQGSLINLGLLYNKTGQYTISEQYYLELKGILENNNKTNLPEYANALYRLANVYANMADYKKAEPLFLQTLQIRESTLGRDHVQYVSNLYDLGLMYFYMGNYENAWHNIQQVAAFYRRNELTETSDYVKSLNVLANIAYYARNELDTAVLLYTQVLAILEKNAGKDQSDYASTLENLANLYTYRENFDEALPLLLESLKINEAVHGKNHPHYALTLCNLSLLYQSTEDFQRAETGFLTSLRIFETTQGRISSNYSTTLQYIANLYTQTGQTELADSLYAELSDINKLLAENALTYLSEQELGKYIDLYVIHNDLILSFAFRHGGKRIQSACFDNSLFYKGILLHSSDRIKRKALSDSLAQNTYLELRNCKRMLAAQLSKPIEEADSQFVAKLTQKANTLEKALSSIATGYSEQKKHVRWHEVRQKLKSNEAVVEFVRFRYHRNSLTDSIMYAALLLQPGASQPVFVALFEEKEVARLLQRSTANDNSATVPNLYASRGVKPLHAYNLSKMYDLLWKPLETQLNGVKKIYFSPSGILHRLNFSAIPTADGKTLSDRFELVEMGSTRQLVIRTQIKIANNDVILFGGIQFEKDSASQNTELFQTSQFRGELYFALVDSTLRGGTWNYLVGTEQEVNSIEKILQTAGMNTTLKKGSTATEEAFKQIGVNNSASPRILHIATHGYFFPDPKNNSQESVVRSHTEPVFKMSDHPMLRSGLIMAGGNAAWQGKQTLEGREDGILTAYEISQMNLSNTELVVLSACETGLGDIQGNEGVYGLQRAFKIAGAKYLIMSLWQVPDKQTSLLMTTFYKKWLENKMTIPDAFHAAQKELREIGLDPYQWAGFVLVE